MKHKLIYFSGVDGSGKSSAAFKMIEWCSEKGISADRSWATLRPVLLKPVILLAKLLLVRKHDKFQDYQQHMVVKQRGINRFRFLLGPQRFLAMLDYYPQYLWKIPRKLLSIQFLFCDRYVIDFFIERGILAGVDARKILSWIRFWGKLFLWPDKIFYFRVTPEVAESRKNDIPDREYLVRRVEIYDYIHKALGSDFVDADRPLDEVVKQVKDTLEEHYESPDKSSGQPAA